MNMDDWVKNTIKSPRKKAMPVLSFPSVQMMGIHVADLIKDSNMQAEAMKRVADRTDAAAAVSMMDLSVEAECFGSTIRFAEDEVPTVVGGIISRKEDAEALKIPKVGAGRTGVYLDAIHKAMRKIEDRPVFAGVIGPFSLAGRLMDVSAAMLYCYDDPEMVHLVLEKVTDFLIDYCMAYKATGANGVIMAEPLAGLLSPALAQEFSSPYIKKIVDHVQDRDFILIYHNCGGSTVRIIDSILTTGAAAYHFGNAIQMSEMLPHIPPDKIAFGNIDPAGQFRNGTPDSIREATLALLKECGSYPNFVISSGCDIPPLSRWENIDAFFAAVREFYDHAVKK
ncbi:MAG TPA: uroporphyrinogen decarboxylase family protein [Clostridia bacterium]|nr:uroporphyrinogen decarboxylase family protein [Clostridia bacterium]